MARLPRLVVPGQVHHLIQRGNNRQPVFLDDEDRRAYLAVLGEVAAANGVALHAYALLDNEVHLLGTPRTAEGLSRMMQSLGRRFVAMFNRRHERSGTLWEGRFRAGVIDGQTYLLKGMVYIETLAARRGLATGPLDGEWSSLAHHLGQRIDPLVSDHSLAWALGNTPFDRQSAYRRHVEQGLAQADVSRIEDAAAKGWGLGPDDFLLRMGEQAGRPVSPRPRGRPRKLPAKQAG